MPNIIQRRRFLLQILASVSAAAVLFTVSKTRSRRRMIFLYRFSQNSRGGISGCKFASVVKRLSSVPGAILTRDWSSEANTFLVMTDRSIEEIVAAANTEKEGVRVELSWEPIVTELHRQKLPLHNYFRSKSGIARIGVDEFATRYPNILERKWQRISG